MPARSTAQAPPPPPPSSRAAGKQPMSYTPPGSTGTGQAPTSARAAAKAPANSQAYHGHNHAHAHAGHPSPPPTSAPNKPRPPSNASGGNTNNTNPSASSKVNSQKIWSTSSTEERERIKEFWLGLGEDERRNLVKIEKDTVLRKMKEQQKHSCACAVCGRKRHAIEEELAVLYDAYYEELENYANIQQRHVASGGALPPPPGPGPFPGSVELDKNGAVVDHSQLRHPPNHKGRRQSEDEDLDDDEIDEEDEEEDEDDENEDDEEDADDEHDLVSNRRHALQSGRRPSKTQPPNSNRRRPPNTNGTNKSSPRSDALFSLGSGLTAAGPGKILTVADDLLKNDGQKFLEMMETLAERRMAREEEAAADVENDSADDEEEEEEDDEEDDEDDVSEDEGSEEEELTEEQKMAEGKRMFSIVAARMFEQRVLQAYRERVAQERQMQLLRELEDEDKLEKEREAKKQSQSQKKRDKKKLQKQSKEEEKALKAATRAAEEQAARAKQQAAEDEARKKRDEERARRKAADDEKARKEEERKREEREREAERERKRKEARREKEERERKDREAREKKEREEKARKEEQARVDKENRERERDRAIKEKREKEEKEAKEKLAAQKAAEANAKKQPRASTSPRDSTALPAANRASAPKKILKPPSQQNTVVPPPVSVQPLAANQSTRIGQPPNRPPSVIANMVPPPIHASTPVFNGVPQQQVPLSPRLGNFPQQSYGMFQPPVSMTPATAPRNYPSFEMSANGAPLNYPSRPAPPLAHTQIGAPIGGLPPKAAASQAPVPGQLPPPKSESPVLHHLSKRAPSGSGPSLLGVQDPGPIGRPGIGPIHAPIAPIARPGLVNEVNGTNTSPRRSPSPKGVLGSAALIADDDELVGPPSANRRVHPVPAAAPIGAGWGARGAASPANSTPWGPPGGMLSNGAGPFGNGPRVNIPNGNLWSLGGQTKLASPILSTDWGNAAPSPYAATYSHSPLGYLHPTDTNSQPPPASAPQQSSQS